MRAFSRFTAAGCLTLVAASWALGADAVRWEPDFETAMQKAAQQNKLVLVHFWNDGCPPCVIVDREVFPSPQVADAVHANYVAVKVHADRRVDLARRFGVEQWPTDVFLSPAGQKVAAYISPKTARDYSEMVSFIAAREQGRFGSSPMQVAQTPAGRTPSASDRDSAFPLPGASNTLGGAGATGRASYEIPAGGEFPLANNRGVNPPAPQSGFVSPFQPAGSAAGQSFPSQPANTAPPLMNPFSQNASPYGGVGVQGVNVAQNPPSSPWNAQSPTGPANNALGNPRTNPQGGLGSPALNQTSPWPPSIQNGPGSLSPNGNVSPQVGQAPMNSSVNGNFQPPAQQPPVQQPPFGAAPPQQQGYAPPQTVPPQQAAPPQPAAPAGPKFAMDGYCVVSLVEQLHLPVNQQQWRKGDPRWGAEHRGKLYLFAGPAEQQKFLANPDYYTPVLLGFDPVLFVEQAQLIEGRREHGFTHEGRIYMFTSEQNLQKFWNSRDMFISRIQQAMNAPPNQQRR